MQDIFQLEKTEQLNIWHVIFDEVFIKFDMLEFIVSDRKSLLTSHY
jgi:hypothetical protein